MKLNLKNFTPVYDSMVETYGLVGAAVYGRIERLSHKYGFCFASKETIGDYCALSPPTVRKWVKLLIKDGYLEDLDPDVNSRAHRLKPTGLAQIEVNIEANDGGSKNFSTTSEEVEKNFLPGSKNFSTVSPGGRKKLSTNKEGFKKEEKKEGFKGDPQYTKNFERWKEFTLKSQCPLSTYQNRLEPMDLLDVEINSGDNPENTWALLKVSCPKGSASFIETRILGYDNFVRPLRTMLGVFNLQIKLEEV